MNSFKIHENSIDHICETTNIPIALLDCNFQIMKSPSDFYLPQKWIDYMSKSKFFHDDHVKVYCSYTEVAFIFPMIGEESGYISVGPLFRYNVKKYKTTAETEYFRQLKINWNWSEIESDISYFNYETMQSINIIANLLCGINYTMKEFRQTLHKDKTDPNENNSILQMIDERDSDTILYQYEDEKRLVDLIKKGDNPSARAMAEKIVAHTNLRTMQDPMNNMRYKMITLIALISHGILDVGVPVDRSFALADTYVQTLDKCANQKDLRNSFMLCIIDFCALVTRSQEAPYPYWIRKCREYIRFNLHHKITLEELGTLTALNPAYLSSQYKKITGESISDYINRKKIDESKFLLIHSDRTLADIALTLNYSSVAYFIKVFKRQTNQTPNNYRHTSGISD